MKWLEIELAGKVRTSIEENKPIYEVDKYYFKYLEYTRFELQAFDVDLQNEIMYEYSKYLLKGKEKWKLQYM